jgi:hypothetical protein
MKDLSAWKKISNIYPYYLKNIKITLPTCG